MALPPIPSRHVDSAAHRQRIAETVNGIASFQYDDSRVRTPLEVSAGYTPRNFAFPPGHIFRYFTDAQRLSALIQDGLIDHTIEIQQANDLLEGRAPGSIATLGAITGGAAYVNGSYTSVPLTGGAGSGATANITVAGGAVTVVTLVNPGRNYIVGNALSASNVDLGGAGAGFSIPVATLATGGAPFPGGTLFFPGGLYNINPALLPLNTLRVGGNVKWLGDKTQVTCFNSSNKVFGGNLITMGPDQSGFWPWSGIYTVGTSMESIRISLFDDNAHNCIIFSAGAHQYCHLQEIKIEGVNQIGISLGSTGGPAYTWLRDIEISAGTTEGLPSSRIALVHNTGSILDVKIFGCEGRSAAHMFSIGVFVQEGSLDAETLHFEYVTDGVYLPSQSTPNCTEIKGINGNNTCTNLTHIANPCNQTVSFKGIMGLTGDPSHPVGVLNDVTGEALLNVIQDYSWSGDTSGFRSGSFGATIVHNTPHIRYGKSATQAIAQNTLTQLTFPTKVDDWQVVSEFVAGVYTPKVQGRYLVTLCLAMASTTWAAGTPFRIYIRKNGTVQSFIEVDSYVGTFLVQLQHTDTVFCNGSTDTIDTAVFQGAVASLNTDSSTLTCYITIDKV